MAKVSNVETIPMVDAYELTEDERKEFDYLNWPAIDDGLDSASFFRYRGTVYDLGEFLVNSAPEGWQAARADSYFSAIVIRVSDDGEEITAGLYLA